MSAFDEAWFLLKALPFKGRPVTPPPKKFIPGGTTTPKSKFIPGGAGVINRLGSGAPRVLPQGGKFLPPYSLQQGGTPTPTPTPAAPTGTGLPLEDWWKNHPMNPETVVNNNPPFGPEGGQ